jgi:hypothetical protein
MGLVLIFTGSIFPNFTYPNLKWQRCSRDPLHEQNGQEVAVAFTGEQNFVSSVLASSMDPVPFQVLSLDKISVLSGLDHLA